MKIEKLQATNFMIFNDANISFSPNINIISGENSTGKTVLLKLLYSSLKGYSAAYEAKGNLTLEAIEASMVRKIQSVFRPDNDAIGRLVNRIQGSNRTDVSIALSNKFKIQFGFSNRKSNHIELMSIPGGFTPHVRSWKPMILV